MEENKFKGLWRPRVIWRQKQSAEGCVNKAGIQRTHIQLEAWRDVFIDNRSLGEPGVQLPLVLWFYSDTKFSTTVTETSKYRQQSVNTTS